MYDAFLSGPGPDGEPAGLGRRLLSIAYDSLLLLAILFLATLAVVIPVGGAVEHPLFTIYLLTVGFLFFGWFWTHGGQTLGMRTWGLRVQCAGGHGLDWQQALVRYLAALLSWLLIGGGFLWSLVDPERATLHDRISGTYLVRAPR